MRQRRDDAVDTRRRRREHLFLCDAGVLAVCVCIHSFIIRIVVVVFDRSIVDYIPDITRVRQQVCRKIVRARYTCLADYTIKGG